MAENGPYFKKYLMDDFNSGLEIFGEISETYSAGISHMPENFFGHPS